LDREQINCYLWVGRLVCPLQSPLEGHKMTGLTPAMQYRSSKGNGDMLPHPKHNILVITHTLRWVPTAWHRPCGFLASHLWRLHPWFMTPTHSFPDGRWRQPRGQPQAWFGMHAFFLACPLGWMEVLSPEVLPPEDESSDPGDWSRSPLVQNPLGQPAPFGRASRPMATGYNPPIPPLGPMHGQALDPLLSQPWSTV
jgi:hypothetical protein